MKFERSDIKHPLWRKKVDSSVFHKAHTPIPNWCVRAWNIRQIFGKNTSRLSEKAKVRMKFKSLFYDAQVTYSRHTDTDYQIFLSKEFVEQMKDSFIMSYMRSLEQRIRKANLKREKLNKEKKEPKPDMEDEFPFWEFLDIEFDPKNRVFVCKSHYTQKPIFPELFKEFISSHILKGIENNLLDKGDFKFIKDNWRPKSDLKKYLTRRNLIYYLIDTKYKLLYIGETDHIRRLFSNRSEIPHWDYFRVDFLPEWMIKSQRLELERLIIRSFAATMPNRKNIQFKKISEWTLVNKKIDR